MQAPKNLNQYLEIISLPREDGKIDELQKMKVLPVEVLLKIFSYLDDLSLWNAGETCKQWKNILELHTPQSMWKRYTKERWPLYQQISTIPNWFHVKKSLFL